MTKDELKEKAHSLPLLPGVYIMMDKSNNIIYVGKSRALKNRVSQYFNVLASHNEKTKAMISQIDHFDYIIADSEFEALVLENSLIKRHMPKYNIALKDGKGYPYIKLNIKAEYPRFTLANRAENDDAKYFGPYGTRGTTYEIIKTILNVLRLPLCNKVFPRDKEKSRPCLNYHIGLCDGWCRNAMSSEEYRKRINQAVQLLNGKFNDVEKELASQMMQASDELRFEQAAELRDRIRAIRKLSVKQKVEAFTNADTDVIGFYRGDVKSCFVVLRFLNGTLADRDTQIIPSPVEIDDINSFEMLSQIVTQYYLNRQIFPRQIYFPYDAERKEDLILLKEFFNKYASHKVDIITPQRGEKLRLIEMAEKNAKDEVERATTQAERNSKLMELLRSMLGLQTTPHRFEAYDISNTGAADIVASMTVFVDGKPLKRDYRHFKITGLQNPDDYASMEQTLTRRFQRYLDNDEKFSILPDLILMDGGLGQVNVAMRVLNTMGLNIPVYGMVKDDRHRTRALINSSGGEIGIQNQQSIFSMIGRIQEETHRFAITYHRETHAKSSIKSSLEEIHGIGDVRRKQLMKHFHSVKAIKQATYEQLCEVLPKNAAMSVYNYYNNQENN